MTIPYSSGQSSASGNASTVNDLGGMNLSTLEDNDLLKRVDANNLGGSGIEAQVSIPVAPASTHVHAMFTKAGVESMASLISQTNTTTNEYKFDVKANAGNTSTSGLTIKDDGSAETRVGINVNDPAETLDITGNLQVRDGDIQYKLTNGTQVVELDGGLDGTDGGKFIVKTKVNNGNMTQKFEINNAGTATLNGAHVAQGYFFAKYGVPRNMERLKTTKEEILSSDSVSQSLADPNKSEPISCQGLLDCAASAVIASTNASGLHTLPPSGSVIKAHLDNLTTNYTFYNTTETSLKSGNATTGTHNNNTYGSWVGIYNQSNVLQLSPSITLTSSSRAVKIETNIHARVDRVRLGFRIIRVVSGQSDVVVVGSEQWGRTVPDSVADDDHFTYCIAIVDAPGATVVTYKAEVYASDPGGSGNSFFEINAALILGGGTNNVNMLLTQL